MKKLIFLGIVSLAIFSSCSKKEEISTNKSTKNPSVIKLKDPSTKSASREALPCHGHFATSDCNESGTCCLGTVTVGPVIPLELNAVIESAATADYFQSNYNAWVEVLPVTVVDGLQEGYFSIQLLSSSGNNRFYGIYDDNSSLLTVLPLEIED